jgi:alkylation response protein AidB-like acyl-CoA dehydrogenase
MTTYTPPLEDWRFVIEQVLDAPASWRAQPAFADLDAETAAEVLAQGGRFAAEVIAPLNGSGDRQGCRWSADGGGTVRTPDGYPAAWQAFVDGGWPALACDPEVGGQGLPQLLNAALFEMLIAANHAWTMYPGLLHGAYEAIKATATPELRERYLGKVVSGEWLATMNLTEPQAGSDLGLIRSKAEPLDGVVGNGARVAVSGNKIFISGGDQDMSANIVHLVLARLPDAPAGTKGLSLILVPKFLSDGTRNAAWCDGIEHKMGIHGSSTSQMRFERATGWLLGEPGTGLSAMFLMMNSARLHVAMQGLAHLEGATQKALAYAAERVQLRAPGRPADAAPSSGPDPIVWHPAMRRILLTLQAQTEGARVLAGWIGLLLDESEQHPDTAQRARAADLVALLTPVAKAFLTDLGHRGADDALGVFGGYGYVHEYGIEQQVRDSRIAMIYEGTNEIQAIDLVIRKWLDTPRRIEALLDEMDTEAAACEARPDLAIEAAALRTQIAAIRQAGLDLHAARAHDAQAVLAVADDALHGLGHALLAWAWARMARCAERHPDPRAAQRKRELSRFGLTWLMDDQAGRWNRLRHWQRPLPWVLA